MSTRQYLESLTLTAAPPLDPAWLQYEEETKQQGPPRVFSSILERQPVYAQGCRDLNQKMMAPGTRDFHLSQGIDKTEFTITSSVDGHAIPILQLDLAEFNDQQPETVIFYYHGGGLAVGEADSEEFSCRRLLHSGLGPVRLYSVGYRLMPSYAASICLSDSLDGFKAFQNVASRIIVVGSSSGGQMAAAVSQAVPKGTINGILLRCPVTADAHGGMDYIPERLRPFHTSVSPTFVNSVIGYLARAVPRDGLPKLPLEAAREELEGMPRAWIQVCTNDTLYSDGLCYALALEEAGVEVSVDVVRGWPHTFWLKAPQLSRALEADEAMLKGLKWLLQV